MAEAALLVISQDEQGQDTFINIMERLHPSKHVISIRAKKHPVPDLATEQRHGDSTARKVQFY